MADPALHIKDAYFFEVPKFAFPRSYTKPSEFPSVWLKLDPTVQLAEAELLAAEYPVGEKSAEQSVQAWQDWSPKHHHAPYDVYYEEEQSTETEHKEIPASFRKSVQQEVLGDTKWLDGEVADKWSEHGLLAKYNKHLSGKIIIPQPFGGELRNLHEAESGFCVSKFMLVELVVVSVVVLLFARLGKSISGGKPAKGTLANFLETFLLFIRDEVVRPSIGSDADFHHGHDDHHDDDHGHGTDEDKPDTFTKADKITPVLWTIFFFILTCNLFGLIPFIGSPTGTFAVTGGLAVAIFLTSLISGSIMHGPVGFWLAQLPSMDLHISIGIIIKPMLWVIEVIGLFIKHAVLAIRLLANMVAGHMVLLSIMGMAIAAADGSIYWGVAPAAMIGATCIGMLELFVAFLQAYVFTLLSALFIGAAMHDH
ncbi:MAG: ATP synthase F0 subunit A [Rhodopirellula sp.]|nr:ATP synthase F0 subunit A [Rhodopirellula sp.]